MEIRTVVVLFSIVALSLADHPFQNIFVLDCNGGFHLAPNFGGASFYFDANKLYTDLANWYVSRLKSTISCECPGISDAEFKKHFLIPSIDFLLNELQGRDGDYTADCSSNAILDFMSEFHNDNFKFKLPSSCSLASWVSGQPCRASFDVPSLEMNLNVAIDHCPDSWFPFVSFTCDGAACDSFFKPCNSDDDCTGGSVCQQLMRKENETSDVSIPLVSSVEDLFNGLTELLLYDDGDTSPGCYSAQTVFNRLFQHFRSFYDSVALTSVLSPKFCLFDVEEINIDDMQAVADIFTDELQSDCIESNGTTHCYEDPEYHSVICTTSSEEYCTYTLSSLHTWDGILPGGESASSTLRKNGEGVTPEFDPVIALHSDATVWFHHSCDGHIQMLPDHPFFAIFATHPLGANIDEIMSIVKSIQSCRATIRGGSLTTEAFMDRFIPFAQYFLYQFTAPVPDINLGPDMSDWNFLFNVTSNKIVMPSDCTYDHWLANGICQVAFSGFSSLFDSELILRAQVKKCPEVNGNVPVLPEFYLECAGAGCSFLNPPKACTVSSECPSGSVCLVNKINKAVDNTTDLDFFGWAFNGTDRCATQPRERAKKDIRAFMRHLNGQSDDGLSTNNYCFINIDRMDDDEFFDDWKDGEVEINTNQIRLVSLTNWPEDLPGPTGATEPTGADVSGASIIALSILSSVMTLLAML